MMTRAPRIPQDIQDHIFGSFVDGATATYCMKQAKRRWPTLSDNFRCTVNRYYKHYRETIRDSLERQYPRFAGEVEIDIGFFAGRAAKWRTEYVQRLLGLPVGRIVAMKKKAQKQLARRQPVLGILNRGTSKIFLLPLQSRSREHLEGVVHMIVEKGTLVYSDKEKGLKNLKFSGYVHRQIDHSKGFVDRKGYHINGIESFWSKSREMMSKNFKGIPRSTIMLHIKEREFRYNHRKDLEQSLTSLLHPAVVPALQKRPRRSPGGTGTSHHLSTGRRRRSRTGSAIAPDQDQTS